MKNIFVKIIMTIASIFNLSDYAELHNVKIDIVSNGSGLYESNERYVYKGSFPNNYISFNEEMWRIVSFEKDGSIQIMKDGSIGNMAYDINNSNEWKTSSLNYYLNNNYFNSIKYSYKKLVKNNKVGLISMDDYINSNSENILCGSIEMYLKNNEVCLDTSYMNSMIKSNLNNIAWTSTEDSVGVFHFGNIYFGDSFAEFEDYGVVPTLYLKSNIILEGDGTIKNPYIIKK